MIIVLSIICFIIFFAGLIYLLRDFFLILINRVTFVFKLPGTFLDFGEYLLVLVAVSSIGLTGVLFYKTSVALISYLLTTDLISHFILMRGVFTTSNPLQSPFDLQHGVAGFILYPLLQFFTISLIYSAIRVFMSGVNKKFPETFSEYDIFYAAFLATLILVFSEILLYAQNLKGVRGLSHFFYLAIAKAALINYFLIIAHTQLLGQKSYRDNFNSYLQVSSRVKGYLFSASRVITIAVLIGVMLNLPFYLGNQFGNQRIVLISLFFCTTIFLLIQKKIFKHGINYLGVVVLAEKPQSLLQTEGPLWKILNNRKSLKLFFLLSAILLLFRPKIFLMLLVFLTVLSLIFGLVMIIAYFFGYFISILQATIMGYPIDSIRLAPLKNYFDVILKSLTAALSPMALIGMVCIVLFSLFPKKIGTESHPPHNYSILDPNGQPLLIKYSDNNISIPVSSSNYPPLFEKFLLLQEDRSFKEQSGWLPGRSNWHGISSSMFYRFLSGTGGGSNLNAQIIKNLAFVRGTPQDLQRKLYESIASFQLSIGYSEDAILNLYSNIVSYAGGSGHRGIMAASYYTFGLPASELNSLEVLYLVKTLKRGQSFMTEQGPVPYSEAINNAPIIKETLIKQAESWARQRLITPNELAGLKYAELRFVNKPIIRTNVATSTRLLMESEMNKGYLKGTTFYSTITSRSEAAMESAVKEFELRFNRFIGGENLYAASLVVEIESGRVLAHHGGRGLTDLATFGTGNPMSSLIKPFIVLELLEAGYTSHDISLYDGQIGGRQTPRNFLSPYTNKYVGIEDMLSQSLNAPFRNLDQIIDPGHVFSLVEKRFRNLMNIPEDKYITANETTPAVIYNYPMGNRRMTVFDLAQIYQSLFNQGVFIPLHALESGHDPYSITTRKYHPAKRQVYCPENTQIIVNALRQTIYPRGTAHNLTNHLPPDRVFYIKTGTSHGAKHGYTVLSDGKILIVTWISFGEENNGILSFDTARSIPFGSGSRSAGVLASLIYTNIYRNVYLANKLY